MTRLSRGWQMRSPLALRRVELPYALSSDLALNRDEVRAGLFTLDPNALWGTDLATPDFAAELGDEVGGLITRLTVACSLFEVLLGRDSDYSTEGHAKAAEWAASFEALAQEIRKNPAAKRYRRDVSRMRLIGDIQQDLAASAARVGMTPEEFHEWLDKDAEDGIAKLPALARIRELFDLRLANADDKWEKNDLNDVLYLASAAAYADIVVGEKKFTNLLARCTNVPAGARLYRRLEDALPHIESLLSE